MATVAFLMLLTLVSLVALLVARRGTTSGDHPHCRKCGFDLFNKPPDSVCCPECGADLTAARAVRIGEVRRSRPFLVITAALFSLCLLLLANFAYSHIKSMDLLPYFPERYVLRQAFTGSPADQQHAFEELTRRATAGAPGSATSLVNALLVRQADRTLPWDDCCGDLVHAAQSVGTTAPGQFEQFLRQSTLCTLRARERVALDDDLHFSVQLKTDRLWSFHEAWELQDHLDFTITAGTLTGSRRGFSSGTAMGSGVSVTSSGAFVAGWARRLGPGVADVTLHVDHPLSALGVTAPGSTEQHFRITILPPGESAVRLAHHPELAAAMAAALELGGRKNGDGTLDLQIRIHAPPMAGAFDLLEGGSVVQSLSFDAGANFNLALSMRPDAASWAAHPVTFTLRPSLKAAAQSIDIEEIYGDELFLSSAAMHASP